LVEPNQLELGIMLCSVQTRCTQPWGVGPSGSLA